jgi:hypothetical protein
LPTLNAGVILQPQYFQGPNFTVRNPVPTYSGSDHYTIDSDFGVFEADGNAMLMRRVAEINAIARLQATSQTKEFTQAAKQAAEVRSMSPGIWSPIPYPRSPAFREAFGASSIKRDRP